MELPLEAGATVRTALHMAAQYGDARKVRLLLRRGADVTLKDREGRTALDRTMDEGVRNALVRAGTAATPTASPERPPEERVRRTVHRLYRATYRQPASPDVQICAGQDALSSFAVAMVQRFDLDPDTLHDCDTTLDELVEQIVQR
ncbi:MAG: hypothetical protein GY913_10560 [Proteobacteria bacterium]|nr:hypothetical protein [Pseudomonadota bacterium]MCP4917354.1 hypothetical protein [Pseudomonadota bacterium]